MSIATLPTTGDASALAAALDAAERLLAGRRIAVLTGAGVSTDSGIPDYRGAGAPVRHPMQFSSFVSDERARKRYWAGSHLGWNHFSAAAPNAGHRVLAEMEQRDRVSGVITQNVDGLHARAGSRRVVELHGAMRRVMCLTCGQTFARADIAERMTRENPWLDSPDGLHLNPDGDVDVDEVEHMVVPDCTVCGGVLKPEVVFFGEFVPTSVFQSARSLLRGSDALLVAGSSLVVNSGVRLLDQAVKRRLPVVIVNRGETRGDARASLKIDAGTSEVLTALAERLG
ncbi:Sir2 family NAD-dependent protein deacetylase [Homoserinibacter sp. GY 40078]|uniref:Sir2 family NAD-dependent protein deacetylase n=1 Tax=Homoserinibacter sp. GY 40078 TaxID=2603275 RepID=UPI0011CB8905|nr:Sir2 family NAD-dependent protein deacetylase [Homoserinibacter sp. GY 40078]TXK17618.1 NAD-dependent deacetylase [Homoserinibacter sp. GY 40078]